MSIKQYYSKQTKYKKWGDFLLFACPLLSGVALDLPLSDNTVKWILAALNIGLIGGKFLLNKYDAEAKQNNAA